MVKNPDSYQANYTRLHGGRILRKEKRLRKAKQIQRIIEDYVKNYLTEKSLNEFEVLDIGCSAGIITHYLSKRFKHVIGIDIDAHAIDIAKRHYQGGNIQYLVTDIDQAGFGRQCFDLIICNSVLEHVPDQRKFIDSIDALLKRGGICFVSVPNKYTPLKEPHYDLYFLSWLPRLFSSYYLRLAGKGDYYYETPLSYWRLRRLCSKFQLVDYTVKRAKYPHRFAFDWRVKRGGMLTKTPMPLLNLLKPLSPSFVFILRKL